MAMLNNQRVVQWFTNICDFPSQTCLPCLTIYSGHSLLRSQSRRLRGLVGGEAVFCLFWVEEGHRKPSKTAKKTTKEPRLELIESIIKHAHFRSYPNNIGLHSTRWCNFGHSLIDDSRPHIWVKREVRSWHGFLSLHGEDRRGIIPKWPNSCHLVMTNIAMRNGPFIDGLPIKNGWIFHGYVK